MYFSIYQLQFSALEGTYVGVIGSGGVFEVGEIFSILRALQCNQVYQN